MNNFSLLLLVLSLLLIENSNGLLAKWRRSKEAVKRAKEAFEAALDKDLQDRYMKPKFVFLGLVPELSKEILSFDDRMYRVLLYQGTRDGFYGDNFEDHCVNNEYDAPRLIVYQGMSGNLYEIDRPDGAVYDWKYYYYNDRDKLKDQRAKITTIDYATKDKREFRFDTSYNPVSCIGFICGNHASRDLYVEYRASRFYLNVNLNSRYSYFFDTNTANDNVFFEYDNIREILCFAQIAVVN